MNSSPRYESLSVAVDKGQRTESRILTDLFVVVVHSISVGLIYGLDHEFVKERSGSLLLSMEIVTIVFHMWYVLTIMGVIRIFGIGARAKETNPYKWLEYSISATIGGFAVAWVNGDPGISTSTQVLLAGAGVAQQASGYQLELRWPYGSKNSITSLGSELSGEFVSFMRYARADATKGRILILRPARYFCRLANLPLCDLHSTTVWKEIPVALKRRHGSRTEPMLSDTRYLAP